MNNDDSFFGFFFRGHILFSLVQLLTRSILLSRIHANAHLSLSLMTGFDFPHFQGSRHQEYEVKTTIKMTGSKKVFLRHRNQTTKDRPISLERKKKFVYPPPLNLIADASWLPTNNEKEKK